jgi:hypothetical protein
MPGLSNIIGWLGVVAVLGCYVWTSVLANMPSIPYYVTNLFGGLALALVAKQTKNWQSVAINLIWVIITVIGLIKFIYGTTSNL